MLTSGSQGVFGLYLLDLATGGRRVVKLSVQQSFFDAVGMAFSPDSKSLFAVTTDGTLAVINRRTGAVGGLGAPLPALTQLILRPAR
jgi:sugar lactone lactonase YvrE